MTGKENIRNILIYSDHVIYNGDHKNHYPSIDGVSLKILSKIVINLERYPEYLLRTSHIKLRKWRDYDGLPFEDFYDILYNVNPKKHEIIEPSITVVFNSTNEENVKYDYTAMASRDTSTAYKYGSRMTPTETRFKVCRAIIKRNEADADTWIQSELARLENICDLLEKITKDLKSWAESKIEMRVFCPTAATCRPYSSAAIITCDQLSIYSKQGLSLEDLKQKLICKVCGKRCYLIRPA
jgi:hypothetical protein